MKSSITLGLVVALGSLGIASTAHATNANHSGTICKNYNAGQVTDIDYLASGTRNLNASPRSVICPLVRSPNSSNNVAVYVDGFHSGTQTTTCTLYSYDYNGTFKGSNSFTQTSTGSWDRYLSVPAGQGPYWGAASVLCTIPGSAQGIIYNVDVVQ
jgi:hypothetical protein